MIIDMRGGGINQEIGMCATICDMRTSSRLDYVFYIDTKALKVGRYLAIPNGGGVEVKDGKPVEVWDELGSCQFTCSFRITRKEAEMLGEHVADTSFVVGP